MAMDHHRVRRAARRMSGAVLLAAAAFVATTGSAAAIDCRGEYQVVQGDLLATPFCQDNYLAHIARQYGSRVSNAEIRHNPNTKADVCRFIGHDSRISHLCLDYRNGQSGVAR